MLDPPGDDANRAALGGSAAAGGGAGVIEGVVKRARVEEGGGGAATGTDVVPLLPPADPSAAASTKKLELARNRMRARRSISITSPALAAAVSAASTAGADGSTAAGIGGVVGSAVTSTPSTQPSSRAASRSSRAITAASFGALSREVDEYGVNISRLKQWSSDRQKTMMKQEETQQELIISKMRDFLILIKQIVRIQSWYRGIVHRRHFLAWRREQGNFKFRYLQAWFRYAASERMCRVSGLQI